MVRLSRALSLALAFTALPTSAVLAQDRDEDGVADAIDAFPCDADASAVTYAPALGAHGLMLFEDLWPTAGDLDFNDVAISYNYVLQLDASGRARALQVTLNARAVGGQLHNGLGLHLPIPRASVASVRATVGSGAPFALTPSADDAELTVIVSDDLRELFGDQEQHINVLADAPAITGQVVTLEIVLSAPTALSIGGAPYDLFVFRSNDPTHQIHRPEYAGTASMNAALFGTFDDGSTAGRRFVDRSGLPFALVFPGDVAYPAEGVQISALYPDIVAFAASGGASARDFYTTNVVGNAAYRDALGNGAPAPTIAAAAAAVSDLCFARRNNAALSAQVTSETVNLGGVGGAVTLAVSGDGGPQISVNGGAFASSVANVVAPATVQLRLTTGSGYGAVHSVVLSVDGAEAATWQVTSTLYSNYSENRSNAGVSNTFTVPAGCVRLRFQAWGAGGGGRNNQYVGRGGGGGYAEAYINATAGQRYTYIVGGGGRTGAQGGAGGLNGGGSGTDAGGGGMSHIMPFGTSVVIVSAGGGGGGTGTTNSDYPGEYIWGRPGGAESVGGSGYFNGSGGTPTTAGIRGDVNGVCPGTNGSWGQGGTGGNQARSGGGGGGHYGGGGGRCNKGAGGGGAIFVNSNPAVGQFGIVRMAGNNDQPGNASAPERAGAGNGGIGDQNGANGRIIISCVSP